MGGTSREGRVVWVVDDSPLDLERARKTLSADYRVETFSDGSALLERLAHTASGSPAPGSEDVPDVIVLDWVMPGVTGPEVCRFLRSSSGTQSAVAILLLTAQDDTSQIVEGLSAGANDFVKKPYAPLELSARVAALVRTKALIERAEQAERTVQRLMAGSPDAFVAIDQEGRITFANLEAERVFAGKAPLLGKTFGELLPDPGMLNIAIGPDDSLFPLPDVRLGDRVYAPTMRLLPTDNASRTTLAFRDVTDRRQADERRLDFYSIIAHDLRSPLSSMLLRTELLLAGKRGLLPPAVIEDVRRLQANMRSMADLINDFLELASLEGAGYKIDREVVDLPALVADIMDDVEPLLVEGRLTWRDEREPVPIQVMGDPRRIAQVLANLIGNAIKFTPPGGSVITRVTLDGPMAEVRVADTGRGISAESLPTLFQRYTRAADAQHQIAGTGLGLLIVREIVEAHGGVVGAQSVPGEGSTFWFRLPLAPYRSASAAD